MADPLELRVVINPITALAFLALDRLYLLAGEGQFLRVFDHGKNKLIGSHRIFDSEAIHGIVCYGFSCSTEAPRSTAKLLLWGGQSISILEVVITHGPNHKMHVDKAFLEQFQSDRILDGCFYVYHHTLEESMDESICPDAFLVNAHNQVISVILPRKVRSDAEPAIVNSVVAGPRSMLYSAHIKTTAAGRILIAAGTFFGEIIFWSFHPNNSSRAHSRTHHIFRGHQGSIYGLRISEEAGNGPVQRILASCSDDRTIRIWDVSNITSELTPRKLLPSSESGFGVITSTADSMKCLATVMAHASRIWGLRFLRYKGDSWGLLSYGEDASAKTWILYPKSVGQPSLLEANRLRYELRHQRTYKFHSGKSVWAAAIHEESKRSLLISTGGSDGRITSYRPSLDDLDLQSPASSCQYTIEEAGRLPAALQLSDDCNARIPEKQYAASLETLFIALEGDWKLSRAILDAESFNPLGTFKGSATFKPRKPSNDSYDAEYLYMETGEFTNSQGLTLNANRQYVWRYDKSSTSRGTITVWFVRTDGSKAVEKFFHTLSFRDLDSQYMEHPRRALPFIMNASGDHLCDKDDYQVDYKFQVESIMVIDQWTADFTVHGPSKNHIISSKYKRSSRTCEESERKEAGVEAFSPARLPDARDKHWKIHKGDAFKIYAWLSETEFLASTEYGFILIGTLNAGGDVTSPIKAKIAWENIGCFPNLRSACIATSVRAMKVALLTGLEGTVYLYQHSIRRILAVHKYPSKLAYLRAQALGSSWSASPSAETPPFRTPYGHQDNEWQHLNLGKNASLEVGLVTRCLGSSSVAVMLLRYSNGWSYSFQEIRLEFQDTFVVTSSRFVEYSSRLLILGSRRGELTVRDLSESSKRPGGGPILRLHNDAITSIMVVTSGYQACVIGQLIFATTGRDGTYKVHSLTIAQKEDHENFGIPEVQTINDCKPPFGPYIEGAYLNPLTQHIYVWGFRSTEFVVWDDSMKAEVLSIECGNAHRRWDYVVHEDGRSGGSFVFTKASLCCTYFQKGASHCVIQSGSHGREAKAMALSPPLQTEVDLRYLATGAEDTAIRIFQHMPADEKPTLHCVSVLTDHTTGIQQLRWSADGRRLFSAAGCEEFFVWRITKLRSIAFGVVCEARCPIMTERPDLRILDFDIRKQSAAPGTTSDSGKYAVLLTIVYSDSSMRIFEYSHWLEDKFNLVFTGSYTTRCLTQIADLRPGFHGELHLCTASTDGSLVFWRIDTGEVPKSAIPVDSKKQLWRMLHEGHEGSVKSLKVLSLSIVESVVVTGGDDGDIRLTHLKFCDPGVPHPTSVFILPRPAHAAAVTCVDCLGTADMGEGDILLLASVSTDQCLKIWIVKLDKGAHVGEATNAITCKKYTNVADPSSLGHFKDSQERLWLFVVGVGVEVWRVNLEALGIGTKSFLVR
ncbi:hypothetical protein N7G274_009013 [Stereocaulon virgatum]|uniref:DUF6314 domain-containing protein n=1 Tax=Stereocaulon virgatum TaxID=373712 RepID=A0ABR4A4T7_9LECA